jgi:uncharacterized membrane protein YccC
MSNRRDPREVVLPAVLLAAASLATYELVTHVLTHVHLISRESDLIGAMWAVIATIFVFRWSAGESRTVAVARITATFLSFVLCLIYLALFPFHPVGLAVLIGIGAILATVAGRPDAVVTTGITTTVIMVVAAISPQDAWLEPILRFLDTLVGVAVGIAAAWIAEQLLKPARA